MIPLSPGEMDVSGLAPVMRLGGVLLPLAGRVRVYACGITPYDVTHLGHAATFVWVDALCRVLQASGAEVIMSRNVTDVDDVLLAAASKAGEPYDELTAIQQFYFERDMTQLGVGRPAAEPRAHVYVGQVIALAAGSEHAAVRKKRSFIPNERLLRRGTDGRNPAGRCAMLRRDDRLYTHPGIRRILAA